MKRLTKAFTRFASSVSRWTGRPLVFVGCCAVVLAWALSGPLFGFSDTWQLVINTSTTIVTFLMVFLIQNTQNRDNNAIHAKLDELIRVSSGQNGFIGIENLPDEELEAILAECDKNATTLRLQSKPDGEHRDQADAKPKTVSPSRPANANRPGRKAKA